MLLTGSPQTPNSMGPLVIDQCNPWSNDYRDTIVAANYDEQADAGLSASPTLPGAPDCTYTLPRPQSPTDFRESLTFVTPKRPLLLPKFTLLPLFSYLCS